MGARARVLAVVAAAWLSVAAAAPPETPSTPTPAAPLAGSELAAQFPSDYYFTTGRESLGGIVLTRWPGPTALGQRWLGGALDRHQRVLILLGGGFFHDRQLLPMYYRAATDDDPLIRQAAVTGYRELLGEQPARLAGPVSDADAAAVAREMSAVAQSLRLRPLVALWVDSLLANFGQSLPGPRTVVLERPALYCLDVIDRLATPEDLPLLAVAYRLVGSERLKLGIVRLFEGLTLRRMIVKPTNPKAGWGSPVWESALTWTDDFLRTHCELDGEALLRQSLAAFGASGVDPYGGDSCWVWRRLLERGEASWWGLTTDRLYDCGAPAVTISRLRCDMPEARNKRQWLLKWYERLGRSKSGV